MSSATLLDTLPEKPEGWTRKMNMHLNFGDKGGAATYSCHDASGNKMPFGYQYDTRKGGLTGFTLPGRDGAMTWQELRDAWPSFVAEQKGKETA